MNAGDGMSPDQALSEIDRVDRRVRHSSRGAGWYFVITGLATIAYWPAMFLGDDPVPDVAAVGWVVLTVVSTVYWVRRRVHNPLVRRLNGPITGAYVVTMLAAFAFCVFVMPERPAPGWVAALVIVSVVAALPLLYAGWRVLTDR